MKAFLLFVKKHYIVFVILAFALYIVIGAMAPFAVQKQAEPGENVFNREDYYAQESAPECTDRAHVVEENLEAMEMRLRMLNEAQERVIISTFDIRQDESTRDLAAALMDAADRGVKIEIMVDGFNGLVHMEWSPFFYAISSYPGIEIRLYNPINLLTPWKLQGRMHDKYVICDDKLMLLGGRNTFGYFIGDYPTNSKSYDREVLIYNTDYENGTKNSVISQVEEYFYGIWDSSLCKPFHNKESLANRRSVRLKLEAIKERWPDVQEHYANCYTEYSYKENTVAIQKATLISGETGIYGKKPYVWDTLQSLMASAKEKVVIHTPYVVMDSHMLEGMAEIAENVEYFSMVTNAVENGDNKVAPGDYMIHKKEILDTGVQIYEFDGGESYHGKTILIDDNMSIIGSYNLDMRSTYMDTELMLAVQGEEFYQELSQYTDGFQAKSRIIIDEDHYEMPEGMTPQELPLQKKILFRVIGFLIQPFRYIA